MAKVLVVGGAGYVGGATCAWLMDRGHTVWVVDDFSTGHTQTVVAHGVLRARIGDRSRVLPLLERERFDCVMHFAAKSLVAESVAFPELYRENNVEQTRALLDMMVETKTLRLVFSSTCATFGDPGEHAGAIDEALPQRPVNPYGETKLEVEQLLQRYARDHGLQAIALRYFNAAGAEAQLRTGEWHEPETHLIPNLFRALMEGTSVSVFGGDYPTPDGTCIRDYIHVTDLASAHEAALLRFSELSQSGVYEDYNLGSEQGYSVLEILAEAEKVLGRKIPYDIKPRRAGDPPRLVANSQKARQSLGFRTDANALRKIIASAWAWEQKKRAPKKAVFLDRDGTLNPDPGYIRDPSQMSIFPGVGEALRLLREQGYWLVVTSNQSGVGRGIIPREAMPKIHLKLDDLLGQSGVQIDHYELCFCAPHEPGCDCRKPAPKMILEGAQKLGIDVSRSFMIGDKLIDVEAGWNAGCRGSLLVETGEGNHSIEHLDFLNKSSVPSHQRPSQIARNLLEAARWITAQDAPHGESLG